MSLLNDMLHDLGRHQKVVASSTGYPHDLLHDDATPFKMPSFNWVPSAIIFAVVFSGVLVFKYALNNPQLSRHLPTVVTSQDVPNEERVTAVQAPLPADFIAAINTPAAEVATTPIVGSDPVVTTTPPNATVENSDPQLQRKIADLLLQANRALSQDKLTSPIEDNAYSYFQKIASLVPNHPQAKIGLELIADRYLQMAREQLNIGNYQQMQSYNQRANFVAPEYFREHGMTAEEIDSAHSIGMQSQRSVEYSEAELPQAETIKPFAAAEVTSLNVVPNATWKDEQIAGQANELLRTGKPEEAKQLLKTFVVAEAKPIRSAVLLGDIYFQQSDADALDVLANNAAFLPSADKAKLRAQMFIAKGDEAAAIAELERELTAADNNESYRALLASLYHKTAQYQKSIVSYQRLLNSYGEKPAYWLGLALAFDGLSQHQNALQAYQHLQKFPQLQQQVTDYINLRIAALRTE